jgi:NADH-quinone oxidoreductase subunit M
MLFERAPLGVAAAFTLPQLGVHAHLIILSGEVSSTVAHWVGAIGGVSSVLFAVLAVVQVRVRRAIAFLVMSQTALVTFGIENHSEVGVAGAVLFFQVLAVASSGFVMVIAALEARRGTLSLHAPQGSPVRTPRMATAILVLGLATVGIPGTIGFVAEDLLVQGSVEEYPALAFALIIATAINGITVMRLVLWLFSGTTDHSGERDLTGRELLAMTVAIGLVVIAGLLPALWLPGASVG